MTTTAADAHREALEARGKTQTALAEARARRDELERMLARNEDRPTLERRDRLRAERELMEFDKRLSDLELADDDAALREAELRGPMVAEKVAARDVRLREILPKLFQLAFAMRPLADELGALKEAWPDLDVYTWPQVQSPDAKGAFQPMLDYAIASARQYGWITEV